MSSTDATIGTLGNRIVDNNAAINAIRIDAAVITAQNLATENIETDVFGAGAGGVTQLSGDLDVNNKAITNVDDLSTDNINQVSGNNLTFGGDVDMNNHKISQVLNTETSSINNTAAGDMLAVVNIDLDNNDITNVSNIDTSSINITGSTTTINDDINFTSTYAIRSAGNIAMASINADNGSILTVDGDLDFQNTGTLINVIDPISPTDIATKAYVDVNVTLFDTWKEAVRATTTADLNATYAGGGQTLTANVNGALSLDGVTPFVIGERVLVKDQATATENGIYEVTDAGSGATPFILTRTLDFNESSEVLAGTALFVQEGTEFQETGFFVSSNDPIILDTDDIDWIEFSRTSLINAGAGLVKTANTIDVVGTTNRIVVNPDDVDIDANYVGQTSMVTVGNVTTGTWKATDIAILYGGTGASTALNARANLGLAIGSDVLAYSALLQSIADLVTSGDEMIYFTGPNAAQLTTLSPYARTWINQTSASALRTAWGLRIGVDVLAYSPTLDTIDSTVISGDELLYTTGAATFAVTPLSALARTLFADADAAAARATMGIGSISLQSPAYTFPLADGAVGQILISDGAGNLSFQNAPGFIGEVNGAVNLPASTSVSTQLFAQKNGEALEFRSLLAGNGVSITYPTPDTIAFNSTVGRATVGANVGVDAGAGINAYNGIGSAPMYLNKTNVTLNYRTIHAGYHTRIENNTDDMVVYAQRLTAATSLHVSLGKNTVDIPVEVFYDPATKAVRNPAVVPDSSFDNDLLPLSVRELNVIASSIRDKCRAQASGDMSYTWVWNTILLPSNMDNIQRITINSEAATANTSLPFVTRRFYWVNLTDDTVEGFTGGRGVYYPKNLYIIPTVVPNPNKVYGIVAQVFQSSEILYDPKFDPGEYDYRILGSAGLFVGPVPVGIIAILTYTIIWAVLRNTRKVTAAGEESFSVTINSFKADYEYSISYVFDEFSE